MAVDPEPTVTTEEFILTTGEIVTVRREQYDFEGDPASHLYYRIMFKVGDSFNSIFNTSHVQRIKKDK
jgi:hypothetical protein